VWVSVGVGWWVWVGRVWVGGCRVGWCVCGRGGCVWGGGLPLRSNIPRSALCATLDTYNFMSIKKLTCQHYKPYTM
jgi:hypothetical protein